MTASRSDFEQLVSRIEGQSGYRRPAAFGIGLSTFALTDLDNPGKVADDAASLDTWYPVPCLQENFGTAAVLAEVVGHKGGTASYRLSLQQLNQALDMLDAFVADASQHPNVSTLLGFRRQLEERERAAAAYLRQGATLPQVLPRAAVVSFIGDLNDAPVDAHDGYLRLHLLSSRKIRPHGCNLDGIFGKLSNVVWTNVGPFATGDFERVRSVLRAQGITVQVFSIDKFPRMTDYVVPTGVRIADADRVRLGAHVGEGTTVMHEGFINFNAGTLGTAMIEGRIVAGVVVGHGTDLGGSASILGTLSGGGKIVVSIGDNCLLGANSGCGIPLGDNCTIEAGCYVTAGAKVTLPDGSVVKARELSGKPDLLFLRNSESGRLEVRYKKNVTGLNEALHKNA